MRDIFWDWPNQKQLRNKKKLKVVLVVVVVAVVVVVVVLLYFMKSSDYLLTVFLCIRQRSAAEGIMFSGCS